MQSLDRTVEPMGIYFGLLPLSWQCRGQKRELSVSYQGWSAPHGSDPLEYQHVRPMAQNSKPGNGDAASSVMSREEMLIGDLYGVEAHSLE